MSLQEWIQIIGIGINFILSVVILIIQLLIQRKINRESSQYTVYIGHKIGTMIDLYNQLIDCDLFMKRYFSGYSPIYGKDKLNEIQEEFIQNNYKLQTCIKKSELFLREKLIDNINQYDKTARDIWNDNFLGFYKYHSEGDDSRIDWEKFTKDELEKISVNSKNLQIEIKKMIKKEISPKQ